MALQGEGDPRWVVREREDGRNVNGWHWEDKDVSGWAQDRIKQLLAGGSCSAETADGRTKVCVDKVESVDGDATLYNRKGVLKVLYDLKVSGKWMTDEEDEEDRTYGEFKFELFDEEPEITATMDGKSKGVHECKRVFVNKVAPVIQQRCRVFIKEMHAGAGQSLQGISVGGKKAKESETKVTDYLRTGMNQKVRSVKTSGPAPLVLKDVFTCSVQDMYLALTDERRLQAITRSRAVSEAKVGGKLNLMNGTVVGEYLTLRNGEEVKMKWRLSRWGDDAEFGEVTVRLETDEDRKTQVEIRIEGVPETERTSTEGFWRVQILQAMKVVMGWGSATHFL
eukprot:GFKZ01013379.1.p1 GENE.GFKZ01013379.1~~GFKZ01013379.1.p1  ORF type:complete len:338 (-),score=54.69 GFKZ01013379.1:924-1937(-)